MGTFSVEIESGDPQGERFEPVSALVDTGSTYTVVPGPLLVGLAVLPYRTASFRLADGLVVEGELGQTWVRVGGKSTIALVVFGKRESTPRFGHNTLGGLLLAPDPVNKCLVPKEALMMTQRDVAATFRSPRACMGAVGGELKLAATPETSRG